MRWSHYQGCTMSHDLTFSFTEDLSTSCHTLKAFAVRRSVEQGFKVDPDPRGLPLTKPIEGPPPFILQSVEDVMYMADVDL